MYIVIKNPQEPPIPLEEMSIILFLKQLISTIKQFRRSIKLFRVNFLNKQCCFPTSTPEKHVRFTIKVHFISPVPDHSKSFQPHSVIRQFVLGKVKLFVLYQIFLSCFV